MDVTKPYEFIWFGAIVKTYFSGTQQSSTFVVWTAPGARETTPKGWALSAPPFVVVSGAPGAVQTPKNEDCWVYEKYVFMIILIRSLG